MGLIYHMQFPTITSRGKKSSFLFSDGSGLLEANSLTEGKEGKSAGESSVSARRGTGLERSLERRGPAKPSIHIPSSSVFPGTRS